ncbi:MAG TPA: metal-sulfur cluster assembly factor [Thermoleophilaceae bacterium]|nr:metal-sulfur cluster assembly factor [Thermoleophilaceae bacterium]
MATLTVDDVQEALTNVIDPELGLDFVELGLIYSVEIEDSDVFVSFSLTSPGCPIGPQVAEQIEEFVGELEGVGAVHSKMTFTPAWTPDMMSEEAKFALGY